MTSEGELVLRAQIRPSHKLEARPWPAVEFRARVLNRANQGWAVVMKPEACCVNDYSLIQVHSNVSRTHAMHKMS